MKIALTTLAALTLLLGSSGAVALSLSSNSPSLSAELAAAVPDESQATEAETAISDLQTDGLTSGDALMPAANPFAVAAAVNAIREAPGLVKQCLAWREHFENLALMMQRLWKGGLWPLWCVVYEDGTVVYNKFRAYRTMRDVVEYFTGRSPDPDCDAWTADGRSVCYDRDSVQQMRYYHGEIVNITCLEE